VADLIISERVRAKISGHHKIDPSELRQAIVAVEGLRFKPRSDLPRGPRYYVEFWIGDDRVLAALYPVAHPLGDVYTLGSAYREPRGLNAVGAEPTTAGEASSAGEGTAQRT
jgi:hypothetical protein